MIRTRLRLVACSLLAATPALSRGLAAQAQPGDSVWRNYDFVPGVTVWKVVDLAGEPVGRFPAAQLEFVRGNLQVVERNGQRVLEAAGNSVFRVALPRALPEAFTLEFSLRIPTPNLGTRVYLSARTGARYEHDYLDLSGRPGIYRQGNPVSRISLPDMVKQTIPVRLQVHKAYAILYLGSVRAAQLPTANFPRGRAIEFQLEANPRFPAYVSDIVVAVGLDQLYDGLIKTGSFTTRGISFDTGSDRLRPESTPVLEELLAALTGHPELRLVVEGHTDAQGEAAYNQTLSDRRAAAVVRYLVEHGVAASRLTSVGKGEAEPAADNATAEGRQQNRRVVFRIPR